MTTFAIGVDLGGTNLRIAAVDSRGKTLEKITTTSVARGRDLVIDDMCRAIQQLTAEFRSETNQLAGIGIGVPGIIEMETGTLRESPNLPGWQDYPVQNEIERRLGTRVILENDANAAALGEKWLWAAANADDMCMITLGTGGGGIVLQGKIWHGMSGMAGEPGHMNVEQNGAPCNCGSRGCLEQYASATAIKRMAMEAVASGKAPEMERAMKDGQEFNSKEIYQLAQRGDGPAREVFRRAGSALGIVVADLINALNLPMYVIGGGVVDAWEAFAPSMMEVVQQNSYVYQATASRARRSTAIARALLGSDAGLVGAAFLPMTAFEAKFTR
jgi:glucokinase